MQGLPKQSSDIAVHLRCIPVAKQDMLGTKQLLLSQCRWARAKTESGIILKSAFGKPSQGAEGNSVPKRMTGNLYAVTLSATGSESRPAVIETVSVCWSLPRLVLWPCSSSAALDLVWPYHDRGQVGLFLSIRIFHKLLNSTECDFWLGRRERYFSICFLRKQADLPNSKTFLYI